MEEGQDFAVLAGDNPPVLFTLTMASNGQPLDLSLLDDMEWGASPMPGEGLRDPAAVVTKRLSTGGIVVDGAPGVVRLILDEADLDQEPGQYAHQLRGVFAAGYRDTLAKGTLTIEHSPL